MHHPDICKIMLVIEDYFLLVGSDDPTYQIEPINSNLDQSNSHSKSIGIRIKRKLINGFVFIEVRGEGEDDDTVRLYYSSQDSNDELLEAIQIESRAYCPEIVRDVMRRILTLDKNPIKPKSIPIPA
jgi:hypothetical protein